MPCSSSSYTSESYGSDYLRNLRDGQHSYCSNCRPSVYQRTGGKSHVSLDAFVVNKKTDPHQVVIVFNIVPTGREQIEPFTTTLTLGLPAGKQLAQAMSAALGKESEG